MRKLPILITICFIVAASVVSARAESQSNDPLANVRFLIGTWKCTSNMAAFRGMPAMTVPFTFTFSWGPDNASVHEAFTATHYEGHGFLGFDPQAKAFFEASADNYGDVTLLKSQNASAQGVTFVGTATMRGQTIDLRSQRTKLSDTHIKTVTEAMQDGTWKQIASDDCTKS